jgi:hypothetical protein
MRHQEPTATFVPVIAHEHQATIMSPIATEDRSRNRGEFRRYRSHLAKSGVDPYASTIPAGGVDGLDLESRRISSGVSVPPNSSILLTSPVSVSDRQPTSVV